MEAQIETLYRQMDAGLQELDAETEDPVLAARKALMMIRAVMSALREYLSAHPWKDRSEEIRFFKHEKPRFQGRLIYYLKKFHLETRLAAAHADRKIGVLTQERRRIEVFFEHHREFYQYYITGAEYMDEWFFVRNRYDPLLADEDAFMALDPDFCTLHSYKVARILAYRSFREYLEDRLEVFRPKEPAEPKPDTLIWSARKTELVELLYALHTVGAFNQGTADITRIAEALETAFQVRLGNFYHVFQELRNRKRSRTPFLDQLKHALSERLERMPEAYPAIIRKAG